MYTEFCNIKTFIKYNTEYYPNCKEVTIMIFSDQYANRADRNIHMLKDTLEILKKRKYDKDGNAIRIKLSRKQME